MGADDPWRWWRSPSMAGWWRRPSRHHDRHAKRSSSRKLLQGRQHRLVNELKLVLERVHRRLRVIEAAGPSLRLHAFYPGPASAALHPDRPPSTSLEGAGAGAAHPLHRARGRDQHGMRRMSSRARPRPSTGGPGKGLKVPGCCCSASPTRGTSTTCARARLWSSGSCSGRAAPSSPTTTARPRILDRRLNASRRRSSPLDEAGPRRRRPSPRHHRPRSDDHASSPGTPG